jgi:hypothetical protein
MATKSIEKTYERKEITDSPNGVLTASMAIRHYNRTNKGHVVTQLQSFKCNHEDGTVTLKVAVKIPDAPLVTGFCAKCVDLQNELEDSHKEYQDLAQISMDELKEKSERVEFWKAGCKTLEAQLKEMRGQVVYPDDTARGDRADAAVVAEEVESEVETDG